MIVGMSRLAPLAIVLISFVALHHAAPFDSTEIRMLEDETDYMKRAAPLIRFGKRSPSTGPLIRFGKRSSAPLIRFGRSPDTSPLIRFGRSAPEGPLIRFGRAPSTGPLIRFGKRSPTGPLIRFGRAPEMGPLIRFGKRSAGVEGEEEFEESEE
ncbi:unnamed protein product, partial [Mesorhabditis spiculigera]